jgi:hypothetical protein
MIGTFNPKEFIHAPRHLLGRRPARLMLPSVSLAQSAPDETAARRKPTIGSWQSKVTAKTASGRGRVVKILV